MNATVFSSFQLAALEVIGPIIAFVLILFVIAVVLSAVMLFVINQFSS